MDGRFGALRRAHEETVFTAEGIPLPDEVSRYLAESIKSFEASARMVLKRGYH